MVGGGAGEVKNQRKVILCDTGKLYDSHILSSLNKVIRTQPCSFTYVLSMVAFMLPCRAELETRNLFSQKFLSVPLQKYF